MKANKPMTIERYFKVEGNIIYSDQKMLTWGPFYYHNYEDGKKRRKKIMEDIISWCNQKDSSLNIQPEDVVTTREEDQISFSIIAWKNERTLEKCDGIIEIGEIFFED